MTYQQFQPHWKDEQKCYDEEQVEVILNGYDNYGVLHHKRQLDKNGKPLKKSWPRDKPVAQIAYENWLERVVNPDTNTFYPALNKDGSPIKGTGPKRIVQQIVRIKRKDGTEFLYSIGEVNAFDNFGNPAQCTLNKPETWKRTLFTHERWYDERTNSTKVRTTGTSSQEDVYELPFNEKNLKSLLDLRLSDGEITLAVKEEGSGKAVEVKRDVNINKTIELFLKPFDYLFNAEYISPQQRAENRQQAIDAGLIAANTPLDPSSTAPPPPKEGTYS